MDRPEAYPTSEEDVFGPIDGGVEGGGGEDGGGFSEDGSAGDAGDGGEDQVAPVGQGLGSVIEMGAAEDQGGGKEGSVVRTEAEHEEVLDERAEEDLFRQGGADENEGGGREHAAGGLGGGVRGRDEA